ncbi:suppressor of the transcriptional defect of hpr1 by overexpression [Datura stramonium]|uniref:Suppressor of the transcriptional defect of hpr1 by overexpression n=1 Tax=Datura stramonium TaxID=4076 RepID=A0ABS8VMS6_DATST|nr:suppressor of the transcriptional defect of hpr1 by overexpression [Datura stramonium]
MGNRASGEGPPHGSRVGSSGVKFTAAAVQSGQKVMKYGGSIVDGESSQGQIPRLLDIVLYLCEKEHVEGGMIFQLLEDLTEMSTMRNCEDVFGYIESKQDILGKPELFARGKLVMLRTCNQLLRRLSKANDVVFCGRIIMFLAHFFPLSERSAVNIKGVFNTSNETKYETEAPEGISIDFNFYRTLWSLQEHFCNPPSLINAPGKWHKFTSSLTVVLNTFEAQPLSDEEGNAHNLEDDAATFNIKYLTSSKLMGLELKDPSFRRHVLVQCLILFDYLKVWCTSEKRANENVPNVASAGVLPGEAAPGKSEKELPSESMVGIAFAKEEIKTSEQRVKKLLEMTPPKGIDFLHSIEHILERERNWVWWKRDGCPPFEKQPVEKKLVQDGTKKRRPRWRLGNKELSQLWRWADQYPNALTDTQRVCTPAITDYWKPLAEDMDESAGIEAEYHHKNNRVYCWKGLRFSMRQDLEDFPDLNMVLRGSASWALPTEVRARYQAKPSERTKRTKKEETTQRNKQKIRLHATNSSITKSPLHNSELLHSTLRKMAAYAAMKPCQPVGSSHRADSQD